MPNLPHEPNVRSYRGSKENLRRRNIEFNAMARRVAAHLNTLIADDPGPIQQYSFSRLAQDLGLTTDDVRSAISNGGYNGITFGVNDEDRKALARFKSPDAPLNDSAASRRLSEKFR